MNRRFRQIVRELEPKFRKLIAMAPVKYRSLHAELPSRAIYLFSEGSRHLYVGRTDRLRQRLRNHCVPSSTHFSATFAIRIARAQTGHRRATYRTKGSRAELLTQPGFRRAFTRAKERVGRMDIRFVEETDPVRHALLELYAATALGTKYNDFDTH